jgi:fibronectin type 3 domain-containing protein
MTAKNRQPAYGLMVLVWIVILAACDSGSSSKSSIIEPDEDKDTGSISFEVIWEDDEPEEATAASGTDLSRAAVKSEGGIDCVGRGIATIGVTLYDSEKEEITSQEWLCDKHSGIIDGIPAPQSNVTLMFVAKNENKDITYRGKKGDLTINVGPDNHAGAINVLHFKPPAVEIADAPNTIKWNAVTGATSYWVTISDKADFSSKIIDEPCETTEFTATGLEPGVLHYVKIYAQDDWGLKSAASEVGALTPQELAAVPQNITAEDGLRQITLNWEGADATRFNVYWSITPNVTTTNYEENGGKIEDIEPGATPFVHENLQDNTVYYYVVTAENSVGQESAVSTEVFATAVGEPYSPADVTATAEERKVTLNWTAAAGFTYNIYWSTEPGVSVTNNQGKIESIDADTWVHDGCEGVKHYYIVTAVNELGESVPSAEISTGPGWIQLAGDGGNEIPKASAVDADGNVYTVLGADNPFMTLPIEGGYDIMIFKHDRFGVRQWTTSYGGPDDEIPHDVGIDDDGNVYIVGLTDTLDWSGDQPDTDGRQYVFLFKFNTEGDMIWGVSVYWLGDEYDTRMHIAVEGDGTSYITGGLAGDIKVAKFGPDGGGDDALPVWKQTLSSEDNQLDVSNDITLDDQGNIFITGLTTGNLGGQQNNSVGLRDAFVAKLEPELGNTQWLKLIGTDMGDESSAVAVHQNNCYITGTWSCCPGTLFVAKFNADDGAHQWTNQVEEAQVKHDNQDIAVTPDGILLVGTHTDVVSFDGQDNAGGHDALLTTFDAEGNRLWSRLKGTPGYEELIGLTVDPHGYAYLTGFTYGDFGGIQNAGGVDIFLWKLHVGE